VSEVVLDPTVDGIRILFQGAVKTHAKVPVFATVDETILDHTIPELGSVEIE
jgi:hypothetical protein